VPPLPWSPRSGRLPAGARQPPGSQVSDVTFGVINFKSIASAELAPQRLTVLAGANSSGKSSLLQSLLFLAQSFGEPTPVLNGDLVRLGEPRDVIRDGADDLTLGFHYPDIQRKDDDPGGSESTCTLHITLSEYKNTKLFAASELAFWRDEVCIVRAQHAGASNVPLNRPEEILLKVQESKTHKLPQDTFVTISGIAPVRLIRRADPDALQKSFASTLAAFRERPMVIAQEFIRMIQFAGGDESLALRLHETLRQPRPVMIEQLVTLADEHRQELYKAYAETVAPRGWASEPITSGSPRGIAQVTGEEQAGDIAAQALVQELALATSHVARLARAVIYLGPLRDDPRVAYPLGHTVRSLPVGEKGEFTAAYLQENERTFLPFIDPEGKKRSASLPNAVSVWCEHLGIADRISVVAQGKLGHQLELEISGKARDPTAIGVGASQLLPVVVLVLGAPQGSVVLLEQPELHLHPKVQSRLADFFAIARPDIRLVIETHSEYLVTRLRVRVAQGTLSHTGLSVLFASQRLEVSEEEPSRAYTEYRRLSVDELGNFDVWPDEFFDSLDLDSVELAKAVSKRVQTHMTSADS
jgi:predicted ATPase